MSNIMITKKCNLKCPYCFANEFVNKNSVDMTIKDYLKAIDFSMTNPEEHIGIIGGEPTVHPQFAQMLEILIEDSRVQGVTIFTNGINLDQYIPQILHPKFSLLINCNSPQDMGQVAFDKMVSNIDLLVNKYYMKDRIALGINMYKESFEKEYILELLKRYDLRYLRTSISVPNTEELKNTDSISHFMKMKESVLDFYFELLNNKIMPFYDCNQMPKCMLNNYERNKLEQLVEASGLEDRNLLCEVINCEPVIDILPDLRAIRCFALSDCHKANISDFNDIFELKAYFSNMFDAYGYNVLASKECKNCHDAQVMKCSGGCYAFKIKRMMEAHKLVSKLNEY